MHRLECSALACATLEQRSQAEKGLVICLEENKIFTLESCSLRQWCFVLFFFSLLVRRVVKSSWGDLKEERLLMRKGSF